MSEVKKPTAKKPAANATAKPVAKAEPKSSVKTEVKKGAPAGFPKKITDPQNRNMRKVRQGTVVSDKMDKTITVLVVEKKPHPLYKKTVTRSKKFKAHDENNECGIGDIVEIMETRPISKDKCFRLLRIIEKAK